MKFLLILIGGNLRYLKFCLFLKCCSFFWHKFQLCQEKKHFKNKQNLRYVNRLAPIVRTKPNPCIKTCSWVYIKHKLKSIWFRKCDLLKLLLMKKKIYHHTRHSSRCTAFITYAHPYLTKKYLPSYLIMYS